MYGIPGNAPGRCLHALHLWLHALRRWLRAHYLCPAPLAACSAPLAACSALLQNHRNQWETTGDHEFSSVGSLAASVFIELTLGHLHYRLPDVLHQPNSPPDYVSSALISQRQTYHRIKHPLDASLSLMEYEKNTRNHGISSSPKLPLMLRHLHHSTKFSD